MQAFEPYEHDYSSGSGCSDLSALENETDTLGRAIIRHERDARRMQAVLNGSSRPFTRAPRTSVSQRLQRLSRTGQEAASRVQEEKPEPVVHQEVPQSVGRAWGRKQRPERRWTHHQPMAKEEPLREENASRRTSTDEEDDGGIAPYRTSYTGDDLLGQDTPPSMRRTRPPSEPSSLRHMNSSIIDDGFKTTGLVNETANRTTNRFSRSRNAGIDLDTARPAARRTIDLRGDPNLDKENLPQSKPLFPPQPELRARRLHDRKLEDDPGSSHARNDSMQLLKRLARVTSMSPVQERTKDLSEPVADAAKQARNASARMEQVAAQFAGVQDLPVTPLVTGGWIVTPKQESKLDTVKIKQETSSSDQRTRLEQEDTARDLPPTTESSAPAQASQQVALADDLAAIAQAPSVSETKKTSPSEPPQLSGPVADALTASPPRRKGGLATRSQDTIRRPKQVTFDLDGRTICEHCGGGFSNVWEALWVELRSNFLVRDDASPTGFRLTWLGAAVLAWLLWYTIETLMCKLYCSPFFSVEMHGYGARPGAPKYPLVTPQVLLQPFEPVWRPLGRSLATVSGITFNWAFGEGSPGYTTPARFIRRPSQSVLEGSALQATKTLGARWTETVSSLATASTRRALASVVNAIDEMAQMWDA